METIPLPTLPQRQADSHKGDYGKILVIAGSENMIGAPALVALAALRAGSGLVRIACPKEIIPAVLTLCPCATAFPWASTKIKDLLHFADEHDVLAVGPGLGTTPAVKRLILELLERHHGPMVFDADALNTLAALETSEWPKRRNWGNIVLTPHMGEYMRLMAALMKRGANVSLTVDAAKTPEPAAAGSSPTATSSKKTRTLVEEDDTPSTADGISLDLPPDSPPSSPPSSPSDPSSDASGTPNTPPTPPSNTPSAPPEMDRTPLAELLARATGCVTLLKGHRTVVTDGTHYAINTSGNPAMATAGSGDVLTGIIAALIGQKLPPLEATILAAHIHGLAGDLARAAIAPNAVGILSTGLLEKIPQALARHTS